MTDKTDAFDEEVENLEAKSKEISETPNEVKGNKKVVVETQEPTERFVAVHQPEIIGIADTVSGEVIIDGLANLTYAKLEAIKLNKLDKIEVASGVNN